MNTISLAISGISIKQDSHGRFCLNDLHKAAGYIFTWHKGKLVVI